MTRGAVLTQRTAVARHRHAEVLMLCVLVLAAAPMLEVRPQGRVGVRGVPALVLPPSCPLRELLGIDCPGCGLTRSFVHLGHANWRVSLASHRVGWLLMTVAVLQIPYRAALLCGATRLAPSRCFDGILAVGLLGLLLGNWLLKLLGM